MQWIQNQDISILNWPSLSPDLNPIENFWSQMAKNIYEGGRQYANVETLKAAILDT